MKTNFLILITLLISLPSSCAENGTAQPEANDDDQSSGNDDDSAPQPVDIGPGTTSVLYVMATLLHWDKQCTESNPNSCNVGDYKNFRWTITRGQPLEEYPDRVPITLIAEREKCLRFTCVDEPPIGDCKPEDCLRISDDFSRPMTYQGHQYISDEAYGEFSVGLVESDMDTLNPLWQGLDGFSGRFYLTFNGPELIVSAVNMPIVSEYGNYDGNQIIGGSEGWFTPYHPLSLVEYDPSTQSGFGDECDAKCP